MIKQITVECLRDCPLLPIAIKAGIKYQVAEGLGRALIMIGVVKEVTRKPTKGVA